VALSGDFDFKGSFYYGAMAPEAPNPCLNIDGLGPVGLPLSPRDAKALIECSTQAPFGHGERTVVDTEVRDTWEIEPTRIKFDNPAWTRFLQTSVVNKVWQALGVAPSTTSPRCELYKLLLYETGSQCVLTAFNLITLLFKTFLVFCLIRSESCVLPP
jgi:hypothetical protein